MNKITNDQYQSYKIIISPKARKAIDNLPKNDRITLVTKLATLTSNTSALDIKKLQGHKDLYRIRVGDYRIVFQVSKSQLLIVIVLVAHRKEIYSLIKNLPTLS